MLTSRASPPCPHSPILCTLHYSFLWFLFGLLQHLAGLALHRRNQTYWILGSQILLPFQLLLNSKNCVTFEIISVLAVQDFELWSVSNAAYAPTRESTFLMNRSLTLKQDEWLFKYHLFLSLLSTELLREIGIEVTGELCGNHCKIYTTK